MLRYFSFVCLPAPALLWPPPACHLGVQIRSKCGYHPKTQLQTFCCTKGRTWTFQQPICAASFFSEVGPCSIRDFISETRLESPRPRTAHREHDARFIGLAKRRAVDALFFSVVVKYAERKQTSGRESTLAHRSAALNKYVVRSFSSLIQDGAVGQRKPQGRAQHPIYNSAQSNRCEVEQSQMSRFCPSQNKATGDKTET